VRVRILLAVIIALITGGVCLSALQTTRSVKDGVYTEEQRKRGYAQFQEKCSMCHGADMNGGEEAPALFGGNFLSNWNGLTVGDLADRIRVSMPPSNPEINNAQQRADIISQILSANGYPTGAKELDSRIEFLKQIKIEMK
jgi:mono/diheme cytochrome c family protein